MPACCTAMRWFGVSTKPPPPTSTASPAAARTSARVTPEARRRSGSTSTCSCRSRWPQTATLATPGTAIRRGRIVQRTSSDSFIWSSLVEMSPIFIARLVEDSGGISTGCRAASGRRACTCAIRSPTICRARMTSVPRSNRIWTDDRPSTDLERSVIRSGTPFTAVSIGTVTRLSTSSVERPGASVWISTMGGANSGNTSSGTSRPARMPRTTSSAARASTRTRWTSAKRTRPASISAPPRTRCRRVPQCRRSRPAPRP